jgi:hypothetical protein
MIKTALFHDDFLTNEWRERRMNVPQETARERGGRYAVLGMLAIIRSSLMIDDERSIIFPSSWRMKRCAWCALISILTNCQMTRGVGVHVDKHVGGTCVRAPASIFREIFAHQ